MKKIIYCFWLLHTVVFSQDILFNKSIELQPDIQHETVSTVLVNENNEIYAIGRTKNRYDSAKDSLFIVQLDKYGQINWLRTYDFSSNIWEFPKESILLSDGNLVIGGTVQYQSNLNQNAFLLKLDSLGNILWFQEYGDSYYQSIYDLKSTQDGGFIFGRRTDKPPINGLEDAWLVKTDNLGNIEWEKKFGDTSNNSVIRILVEENIYTLLLDNSTSNDSYVAIYQLDEAGNILESEIYDTEIPYINYGGFWDIEGSALTLGMRPVADNLINFDGYLAKIDTNMNIVWDLSISEGINTQEWFYKGVQLPDNSYLIAGSSSYNQDSVHTFRGWLVKVSESGELLWSKIFQHDEDNIWEYFEDMALSPDGTVVIVGFTGQLPEEGQLGTTRNNMWILKVDYEGNDWLPFEVELSAADSILCLGDSLALDMLAYNGTWCVYSNGTNCPYDGWWEGSGSVYLSDSLHSTPFFIAEESGIYDLRYHLIDELGDTAWASQTIYVLEDQVVTYFYQDSLWMGDSLTLMPVWEGVESVPSLYEWSGNGLSFLSDESINPIFIAQDTGIFYLDLYYEYVEGCGLYQQFEIRVDTVHVPATSLASLVSNNGVTLYPNPARTFVTIKNHLGEEGVITFYDTQARPFYSSPLSASAINEIELVDWKNGTYFYTIVTKSGERQTGKLIVLR